MTAKAQFTVKEIDQMLRGRKTIIALDHDGRIYAAPTLKALVRNIYNASVTIDGSRNMQEWMEGIAERGKIGGFTKGRMSTASPEAFFKGLWALMDQGSKVQS